MTKEELLRAILDEERDISENEEIIHTIIQEKISQDVHLGHSEKETTGEKMADQMARIAGSWIFIGIFMFLLLLWIGINAYIIKKPFDPFPFILLNLILSCLAAIQAPVIMMSQNRQEAKDRLRSKNDYRVNLKSEVMVEDIHEKLDNLLESQKQLIEKLIAMEAKSQERPDYKEKSEEINH